MARRSKTGDRRREPLVLDLYVEVAPGGACMGHIPSLPGLSFRADHVDALLRNGLEAFATYGEWLTRRGPDDLALETNRLLAALSEGGAEGIRLRERERVAGAPVWESGNAAALFFVDHRAPPDPEVRAHLRFIAAVVRQIRSEVDALTPRQRAHRSVPDRRSIDEALEHIGNCVWWYASRIDDTLHEPPDVEAEDPLDRIDRLLGLATDFLLSVPMGDRQRVHVPKRFPTNDPDEPWTFAKVCRREAEHVWAHLPGITRDVRAARRVK